MQIKSNRCRLWGSGGLQTVYEDSTFHVTARYLSNETNFSSVRQRTQWGCGSEILEHSIFAPAAFLANGKVWFPVEALSDLPKFRPNKD